MEHVVLVNEQNQILGTMNKKKVHTQTTPLHRGFSFYLFHSATKKILIQQRSHQKLTWPLIWSNSCCGHPQLKETNQQAVKRRVIQELGISKLLEIQELIPDYRYTFKHSNGIVENEFCPILVGVTDQQVVVNREEVERVKWLGWEEFLYNLEVKLENWSEWCVEEAKLLQKNPQFKKFLKRVCT